MKVIKGVVFFFLLVLMGGSCLEPPEFSNVPEIEFENVTFLEDKDIIRLSIKFKDGNGDLGLETQSDIYDSNPYHPDFYFLANNGQLTPITTISRQIEVPPGKTIGQGMKRVNIINIGPEQLGKLAIGATSNDPAYDDDMEDLIFPQGCKFYKDVSADNNLEGDLYLFEKDARIIDETYNILDTIPYKNGDSLTNLLRVKDYFYYKLNPKNKNIFVDFYKVLEDGSDVKIEFSDVFETCTREFYGKYPILKNEDEFGPIEGIIHYDMFSIFWLEKFRTSTTFRLKVWVRDRAGNESEPIFTPEFSLDQIK